MGRSSYLRSRGSSGTSYGPAGMGGSTYTPPNTSQVNPSNPQVKKSIDDRKTAYESMQQAGMLTPNLLGVSLYDQSPVIYEEGTTSQEILGADDPKDIGGQQVDLKGTMVDGLTPFYSTYADDAINTGNVAYKARMYALSKGASEDEAQLIADQANNELKKLVFGGGGGGSYGGGGGDYAALIAAGLGRRPKQLGDEESVPKGLRLLQYMVNLHKENPYTKMALRKKSGGIVSLVGG
jgi:hypothetical protein